MWSKSQEQVYLHSQQQQQQQQQQTLHPPGIIGTTDMMQHHHSTATMDLSIPSNPRASRNMAEKQRRDNLNTNISAMAALVPTVAESPRKMDKISILRLAANFLRIHYTVGRGVSDFLPRELGDLDLEQYIGDNLIKNGSFFIVVTTTGKIVYVSRQVQEHLGHTQADLLGHSLYAFIHPKDEEELARNLNPDEMQGVVSSLPQITDGTNDNSNSSEDSTSSKNGKTFQNQRRTFELRMLHRTSSRREHTQYEWFEFSGILRLADACKTSTSNVNRSRHREITSTSNDIVFVGVAQLLMKQPLTKISIIDANKNEYITRHLVDGRIIYCDHRVSVVAGYLSEEVSGMSAFGFMHKDDRIWAMVALRQMYDRAETCGSSCYRLTSKTGEPIYLRTHGYLEVDKDTQIAVSLVCINTLVSEEEGIQLMQQMKKRFSATISETMRAIIQNGDDASIDLGSDSQNPNSKSNMEDPAQLEDAITYLVSDLSSPLPEDCLSPPTQNEQYAKAAMISQHLPPAEAQARRLGIKKIDRYLMVQAKATNNQKSESKTNNNKNNSNERQENTRSSRKTVHEVTKQTRNSTQDEQNSSRINNMSNVESCVNTQRKPGISQLELHQNVDILNPNTTVKKPVATVENNPCNVKIERNMDVYTPETMIEYFEKNAIDNNSDLKSHPYPLKRIYSDEDIKTGCTKKRQYNNVPYASSDTSDEQNISYIDCKPFVDEEFSELSTDFNNINPQSLKIAESPNSSLSEVITDYQQVDSSIPLIAPNPELEAEYGDLQDNALLSPGLEANPDLIMMKIFDDLRHIPILENTFNETEVQLTDNMVINKEIRKKHLQLMNNIARQESQLNVLARDFKNPALQAKRGSLTPLEVEHNMQKQILETLQKDHMQINIKHNIGV